MLFNLFTRLHSSSSLPVVSDPKAWEAGQTTLPLLQENGQRCRMIDSYDNDLRHTIQPSTVPVPGASDTRRTLKAWTMGHYVPLRDTLNMRAGENDFEGKTLDSATRLPAADLNSRDALVSWEMTKRCLNRYAAIAEEKVARRDSFASFNDMSLEHEAINTKIDQYFLELDESSRPIKEMQNDFSPSTPEIPDESSHVFEGPPLLTPQDFDATPPSVETPEQENVTLRLLFHELPTKIAPLSRVSGRQMTMYFPWQSQLRQVPVLEQIMTIQPLNFAVPIS